MFKLLSSWILAQCPSEREGGTQKHLMMQIIKVINTWRVSLGGGVVIFSRLNKWMALEAKE